MTRPSPHLLDEHARRGETHGAGAGGVGVIEGDGAAGGGGVGAGWPRGFALTPCAGSRHAPNIHSEQRHNHCNTNAGHRAAPVRARALQPVLSHRIVAITP